MTVPALWTRHQPLARMVASEWAVPGYERQDVEQEALIALWEACLAHEPGLSSFPHFARTVIRRHLTDVLRAATRNNRAPLNKSLRVGPGGGDILAELPHLHQVVDRVESNDEVRAVLAAIVDLTPFERRCVLGIAAGLSYLEIGNPKDVDNTLFRARRKLRAAA